MIWLTWLNTKQELDLNLREGWAELYFISCWISFPSERKKTDFSGDVHERNKKYFHGKLNLRQSNWPKTQSPDWIYWKFVFKLSPDCEKASNNDQLYESNTNTTTSSTDLSDFISNSNTSTSGNTRTSNTNSSSNNRDNNSNQLNGQDSSFPAGGKYKLLYITSLTLQSVTQRSPIVKSKETWTA